MSFSSTVEFTSYTFISDFYHFAAKRKLMHLCQWSVVCDLLCVICCVLSVLHDLLCVICCVWSVVCDLFCMICCVWAVTWYLLCVICCLWSVMCYLLLLPLDVLWLRFLRRQRLFLRDHWEHLLRSRWRSAIPVTSSKSSPWTPTLHTCPSPPRLAIRSDDIGRLP